MGWEDNRAVSEVLGAILLFGIIVLAIGGYQAFVVPQQDAEIEFNHNERVAGDMNDLRNAMFQAAGDNEPRSASVELRPQYPSRALAISSSPPAGTLRTGSAGSVNITGADFRSSDVCGGPVETRSITYEPRYNSYQNGQSVTVDSSFVYRQTGGDALIDTSQLLVQGSQIRFMPVEGDLSKSGERATSVTLIPSNSGGKVVSDDAEDNFNISIPTTLPADVWADELESSSVYFVAAHQESDDRVKIEMRGTEDTEGPENYTFRCTAVGLNQQPTLEPPTLPFTDEPSDVESEGLNPYGAFILEDATEDEGQANVTFRHRGNEVGLEDTPLTITEARFSYYGPLGQGVGGGGQPFVKPDNASYADVTFEIGGPKESIEEGNRDTWGSGQTDSISIEFGFEDGDREVNEGDFFILQLQLEGDGIDPLVVEYFVGIDSDD